LPFLDNEELFRLIALIHVRNEGSSLWRDQPREAEEQGSQCHHRERSSDFESVEAAAGNYAAIFGFNYM
jgi:phage gp46-like protein